MVGFAEHFAQRGWSAARQHKQVTWGVTVWSPKTVPCGASWEGRKDTAALASEGSGPGLCLQDCRVQGVLLAGSGGQEWGASRERGLILAPFIDEQTKAKGFSQGCTGQK